VDSSTVLQAEGAVDGPSLVPPIASDDARGKRLAQPLEHSVHDVQVVQEAAQQALAERTDDILVARADGARNLLGLPPARRLDQPARDVAAAHDLTRLEERLELRVVDDDADVTQVSGGAGKRLQHRFDSRVVALHRS